MKITPNGDGSFTIAPGLYAIITAEDGWHPQDFSIQAFTYDDASLTHLDYLVEELGVEMLAIGTGTDRRGVEKRAVNFDGAGVITGAGSGLVMVTTTESGGEGDFYLEITQPTRISLADGVLSIGQRAYDLKRPGMFETYDGMVIDLSEDRIADALGHGPIAEMDEHGMRVWAETTDLAALRAIGDAEIDRLADLIEKDRHIVLSYSEATEPTHAPVPSTIPAHGTSSSNASRSNFGNGIQGNFTNLSWSKPIEAVQVDTGETLPAIAIAIGERDGRETITVVIDGEERTAAQSGSVDRYWRIRNVGTTDTDRTTLLWGGPKPKWIEDLDA